MSARRSARTQTVLFLVFLGSGLVFLGVGANRALYQRRVLAHSHAVPATIVGFDVEQHTTNGRGGTTYRPVVRFEYQVDGTTRMGDQVGPLRESRGGHWAWRVLDRYEVGQRVTAWVRDDVPDGAFLEHVGSPTPYYLMAFGAVFTALVGWAWLRAASRTSRVPSQPVRMTALGTPP